MGRYMDPYGHWHFNGFAQSGYHGWFWEMAYLSQVPIWQWFAKPSHTYDHSYYSRIGFYIARSISISTSVTTILKNKFVFFYCGFIYYRNFRVGNAVHRSSTGRIERSGSQSIIPVGNGYSELMLSVLLLQPWGLSWLCLSPFLGWRHNYFSELLSGSGLVSMQLLQRHGFNRKEILNKISLRVNDTLFSC